jgi:predicted DNA-binding WGR domain protein
MPVIELGVLICMLMFTCGVGAINLKPEHHVIDLESIDSSRNRHRLYRIVRRGTVVSTMHGRRAPNERPYLKRAKSPRTFDCEEDALEYVDRLIRTKVNKRTDPYTVVESQEVVG